MYPKLKIYLLTLSSYEYVPVAHVTIHCVIWP